MAAAIPLILFAGWVVFLNARQDRTDSRLAALETLDRVVTRISSDLTLQVQIAETLAASASLDTPDLSSFYVEALRVKETRPLWETIELVDPKGTQVLNLLRPIGADLGATADRENFERILTTRKAAIGGIGPLGPISGKRLVALRAPVERKNELKFVLTVALVPDAVSQILKSAGAPPGWVGLVVDGRGNIVARTVAEQFELGRPASASVREAISRGSEGSYVGTSLEGAEVDSIYKELPGTSGWSVHFGIPTDELRRTSAPFCNLSRRWRSRQPGFGARAGLVHCARHIPTPCRAGSPGRARPQGKRGAPASHGRRRGPRSLQLERTHRRGRCLAASAGDAQDQPKHRCRRRKHAFRDASQQH
ncbi:cache domain-containing protein [Bradyrhizobium betae]|uniref:cache domain-containing protein n=1 Tax=Bradyrhizobium betae TaxID=244734 RepID=UPI003D67D29B